MIVNPHNPRVVILLMEDERLVDLDLGPPPKADTVIKLKPQVLEWLNTNCRWTHTTHDPLAFSVCDLNYVDHTEPSHCGAYGLLICFDDEKFTTLFKLAWGGA